MVLFAGGWSDRSRRRKPCMLIPMIGELAGYLGKFPYHVSLLVFSMSVLISNSNIFRAALYVIFSSADVGNIFQTIAAGVQQYSWQTATSCYWWP